MKAVLNCISKRILNIFKIFRINKFFKWTLIKELKNINVGKNLLFITTFYYLIKNLIIILFTAENEEMNCVEILATAISIIIMVLTFPISIFICFKVVSEYERAVIFRMGRLRSGGARGEYKLILF